MCGGFIVSRMQCVADSMCSGFIVSRIQCVADSLCRGFNECVADSMCRVRSTAYAALAKVGCGAGRKAVSDVAVAWWVGGWDARAFYRLRGAS